MNSLKVKLPKKLYRHRSFTDNDIISGTRSNKQRCKLRSEVNAALSGKTWFSRLNSQNDPYDTAVIFEPVNVREAKSLIKLQQDILGLYTSIEGEDLKKTAVQFGKSIGWYRQIYWNTILNGLISGTLPTQVDSVISCFTAEPANILMWAYYSQSQSSFSYEFELQNEFAVIDCPIPVDYVRARPRISSATYWKWLIGARASNLERKLDPRELERIVIDEEEHSNMIRALSASKSQDWEHEREWRFVEVAREPGFYSVGPYKLSGINFGARASDALIEFFRELMPSEIMMYKVGLDTESFDLNRSPI
ncbi:MAG: hypothetical protein ACRBBQ_11595 [Cognatishimia sp.]